MSLTSQIGSSDSAFKLSQKLVSSLAEKFGFKFEDGWAVVSSRTVENVQKRLKREKKRSNPAASVKHPRTAFSFFTQKQRPVESAAHSDATFGQLSGFVATAWKALSATELQTYKDMETADKARYQTERAAVLAALPAALPVDAATSAPVEQDADVKVAPVRKSKAKATAAVVPEVAASVAAPAPVAAPTATPTPKAAKAKKVEAAPVVAATPTPTPVAAPAMKAAKAVKKA